jgi:hypothetical protein
MAAVAGAVKREIAQRSELRGSAAAPWTSPWLPPGYEEDFWNAAQPPLTPLSNQALMLSSPHPGT